MQQAEIYLFFIFLRSCLVKTHFPLKPKLLKWA
jgi:hypothetical protein